MASRKGRKQATEQVAEQPVGAQVVVEPKIKPEDRKGKSTVESPVAVTWALSYNACAAAIEAGEPVPSRKALVAAAYEAGVAYHTARTQVQAYLKASKGGTERPKQLPRNVQLPE